MKLNNDYNLDTYELKRIPTDIKRKIINSSLDAYTYIKEFYSDDIEIFESFFILLLNRANNTIGYVKISQGGICGTTVDIKIIAKYCVEALCSNVILAHNHPSGSLKPSNADLEITAKTKAALELLEVHVHDHIILTKNNYFSFADEGKL